MRLLHILGGHGVSSFGIPLNYDLRELARKGDGRLRFLIPSRFLITLLAS